MTQTYRASPAFILSNESPCKYEHHLHYMFFLNVNIFKDETENV